MYYHNKHHIHDTSAIPSNMSIKLIYFTLEFGICLKQYIVIKYFIFNVILYFFTLIVIYNIIFLYKRIWV